MEAEAPPQDEGIGHIPRIARAQQNTLLQQHLDAKEILNYIKKMMEGYEYDDESQTWIPSMVNVTVEKDGQLVTKEVEEGPLMEPKSIRITISYLYGFLNSNTFLSRNKEEMINNIMWDVCKKLNFMFFKLRKKMDAETRMMLKSTIEYAIYHALNRAGDKITLDAVTKIQQSIEHIEKLTPPQQQQPESFKLLGM